MSKMAKFGSTDPWITPRAFPSSILDFNVSYATLFSMKMPPREPSKSKIKNFKDIGKFVLCYRDFELPLGGSFPG